MQLTREDLFRRIWAEPMGKVAEDFGLTGNGLAKICDRLDIPRPPRSYWLKAQDNRPSAPGLPPPPIGLSEVVALGERHIRKSPGTRKRMDAASRRRQLLEVASTIALTEGLSALTMRRLGQAVGISETQVHNSLGGRTDLLIELARKEVETLENSRRKRIARNTDGRTKLVLSTIGYLHEAAQRGPLLQMLLRIPEVKSALMPERRERASEAREPILRQLTSSGRMDREHARAVTAALTAVSLKAGGIVATRRAPFETVELLCLAMILAGASANDKVVGKRA